ncbi:MAG: polysaccharide biosynthesis C-terminal domain-containing protein, partial [Allobaculum sp.]|nr:polysaccharide biosynthesis C-terminal domain-containing protein [Allobaculum sp.]
MNFLTDRIKPMYLKYLSAAFGSALITSIYGMVDMAMVGQYQGPDGSAALAVVAPIWNIIYSLGLLMGIGGSVLFSTLRGQSLKNTKVSNEYYSASLIGTSLLSLLCWIGLIFGNKELLIAFGAQNALLTLAQRYLFPIQFVVPTFLFNQMFAAFLRNDGNPTLATKAVLFGGILNIFGDYFFVFTLNMGIFGAGLATALGSVCSLVVMLSHFFTSKNTLQFVWPSH